MDHLENKIGHSFPIQNLDESEKMPVLDQIFSQQVNVTERKFTVLNETMECSDRNLDHIEHKIRHNFSIQNLNENEKLINTEIGPLDLILPTANLSKNNQDYISKIGRLGELWVNEMLKQNFKN